MQTKKSKEKKDPSKVAFRHQERREEEWTSEGEAIHEKERIIYDG